MSSHRIFKPNGPLSGFRRFGVFGNQGFSYIGVLLLTAVTGIALAGASQIWSTVVKRELEAELFWRGDRIRQAIESYYQNSAGQDQGTYPRDFKDLIRDPRFPGVVRHIRKLYPDPLTGSTEWGIVRDASGRMKGVFSKHKGTPVRTGNFPEEYEAFKKAKTYADWKFVHAATQTQQKSTQQIPQADDSDEAETE